MHAHPATRCLLIGVAHGGEVDHVNTRLRRHDPTSERCQTPSEKSLKLINAAKVCAVRLDASESGLWVCSRRGCGQDSHSILPSSAAFLALIFFAFLGIFSFGRLCCSGCPSFVYHLLFACKKGEKKKKRNCRGPALVCPYCSCTTDGLTAAVASMALRTSATNAEDVAAGFMRFREPLPEHATEITGLIADLYGISTSLNALEELTRSGDFRYRRNVPLVRPDLELVRASLKYTLEDIVDFFGNIDPRSPATREIYKRTWFELSTFFRREINYSLATRLRKYKLFLRELEDFTAEYA